MKKNLYLFLAISLVANLALLFVIFHKEGSVDLTVPEKPDITKVNLEPTYTQISEEDLNNIVESITDTDIKSYANLITNNKGRFIGTDEEDFYYINRGYGYGDVVPEKYQELFDCLDGKNKVRDLKSDIFKQICLGTNRLNRSSDTNFAFIKDFVKVVKEGNEKKDYECISVYNKNYDGDPGKAKSTKLYLLCNALKTGKVEDLVLPYENMRIEYSDSNCTKIADQELVPYCKTLFAKSEKTEILTEKQKVDQAISIQKAKEESEKAVIETELNDENEQN